MEFPEPSTLPLDKSFLPLTLCAMASCGLMAGLFFAFSICVMKSLGQLPPDKGMAAMQYINVNIQNPVFFLVFFAAGASSLWALVYALMHRTEPGSGTLLVGSAFYLVGSLLVTIVVNVPMNDALALAKPGSPEGAQLWATYLTNWTLWNHVRTLASLAATISFALALFQKAHS